MLAITKAIVSALNDLELTARPFGSACESVHPPVSKQLLITLEPHGVF